jgi:integrase
MTRNALTDRTLKSLKGREKPYDMKDTEVGSLRVRVMPSGQRTFVLLGRFPSSPHPTRRALGTYGDDLTLEQAREKARDWRKLIRRGVDPQVEEERQRQAAARQHQNTFAAVAEDFIREKLPGERKGREVERDIRRDFIPLWGAWPITDLTRQDIRQVIEAKKKTAPAQARNLLGTIKRMLSWAVDQDRYGLGASPADVLKPTKVIGEKVSGDRVLNDRELFALWRAATRTPYPYGPVYQVLVLTGLRLNEAADAARIEFDFGEKKLWTIPAARMKGRRGKVRPHAVPLTADVLAVLEKLPHFKTGDFLFSTTFGASPVWMSDKVKKRIDFRMLRTLRALVRSRGEDPAKFKLPRWTNHDIRRTVRSNLSALRVPGEVREAVLAHVRPGIKSTYDLYDYLDEKRDALEQWGRRLRAIVEPGRSNVIELKARA